jgi:hypothetical protein
MGQPIRDGPVADWLSHPQMREFMARFLTALTPFPETRAKVAGIFEGDLGKKSKPIQLFTPDEGPEV